MTKAQKRISVLTGLILFVSVFLTVTMMPRERTSEFSDYREGVLAPERIIAPFDFEILRTEEELKLLRDKVKATVLPIFVLNDTLNIYLYRKYLTMTNDFDKVYSLHENMNSLSSKQIFLETQKDSILSEDPESYLQQKAAIDSVYQIIRKNYLREKIIFDNTFEIDFESLVNPPLIKNLSLRRRISYHLRRHINDRYLDTPRNLIFNRHHGRFLLIENDSEKEFFISDFPDPSDKNKRDMDFLSSIYPDPDNDSLKYWYRITDKFSKSSLIFDNNRTEARVESIQKEVPLAEGLVKKGDEILSRNMVVNKDHLKKLRSLETKLKETTEKTDGSFFSSLDLRNLTGKTIISLLFYTVLTLMLFFNRKKYFFDTKKMFKLFVIILFQTAFVFYSIKISEMIPAVGGFSPYLVTMSVTSVTVAIFFDTRVSFVATLTASVLSSLIVGNYFPYLFIPLFSGLFTMYAVNRIRDIFQFIYKFMIFTFLGLMLPAVGFHLVYNSPGNELITIFVFSLINASLSPIISLTLLTVLERIFKTPTDVSLLQLSDMSSPLLKKLQVEAPGTYHHTVTVGNLAEAAAEAIGANSLLARVGAYYHDIGKTFKAAYFIENQQNISNKHDKMAPNMSAFILSQHVKEGIRLARENKIPEVIIDFISTHHGNSKMEYFYNKALNLAKNSDEKVNESVFRYPGPRPNSKETAIVMIADVVEAKCRTESEANVDRFRQIIKETILERLESGELDECDIKINDLSKIREAMLPVITGMYHQRIKYPEKNNENGVNEQK